MKIPSNLWWIILQLSITCISWHNWIRISNRIMISFAYIVPANTKCKKKKKNAVCFASAEQIFSITGILNAEGTRNRFLQLMILWFRMIFLHSYYHFTILMTNSWRYLLNQMKLQLITWNFIDINSKCSTANASDEVMENICILITAHQCVIFKLSVANLTR